MLEALALEVGEELDAGVLQGVLGRLGALGVAQRLAFEGAAVLGEQRFEDLLRVVVVVAFVVLVWCGAGRWWTADSGYVSGRSCGPARTRH